MGSKSSVAERLFNQYQGLTFDVNDDCVPGLAFRNHLPYLEMQQLDLLRLTSTQIQSQFFQEARIKSAIFMGCNKGEIELGFSNIISQGDIQTILGNLFPGVLSLHSQYNSIDDQINIGPSSSNSSSYKSLSSPSHSHFPETETLPTTQSNYTMIPYYYQQTIQTLLSPSAQVNIPRQFSPESEHDAIVRAILHVISSTSPQQNMPNPLMLHSEATAFKRYRPQDRSTNITSTSKMGSQRQSMVNRSIALLRGLNSMRVRERIQATTRPNSIQLHHMISERRRREKLNDNFQALRALLPPGTKRDKASILTTAKKTMSSLIAEIEELQLKNHKLVALLSAKELEENKAIRSSSSNERLNVEAVSNVNVNVVEAVSSSSEERMVELQVSVRGELSSHSQADILIRLLEFLKGVQNIVSLISMDANTHITQGTLINQLTFRLRSIEGSEWDESAFREAVRRVVADLLRNLNQ
ncbi:Myc-type, basic helix-loop-helix [Sesbania bispinosa]|nr:Myc-type, basic helix-loop-helix [Sesbania bispinosa]